MPKSKLTTWFVQNGTSTQIREMFEADLSKLRPTPASLEEHSFADRWRRVVRGTGSQDLAMLMVQTGLKICRLDAVNDALGIIKIDPKIDPQAIASVQNVLLGYVKEAGGQYSFVEIAPMCVHRSHSTMILSSLLMSLSLDSILALYAKPVPVQRQLYWRVPDPFALSKRVKYLEQVVASYKTTSHDDRQQLLQWERDKLGLIMAEVKSVDLFDATTLVSLVARHQNPEWIDKQ